MPVVTSKKSAVPAAQAVAEKKMAAKKKVEEPVEEVEEEMEEVEEEDNAKKMEEVVEMLKSLEAAELFKVMKVALSHAEKKSKAEAKTGKSGRGKKAGSAPKGVAPPQLRKPRAWVDFTRRRLWRTAGRSSWCSRRRRTRRLARQLWRRL